MKRLPGSGISGAQPWLHSGKSKLAGGGKEVGATKAKLCPQRHSDRAVLDFSFRGFRGMNECKTTERRRQRENRGGLGLSQGGMWNFWRFV